MLLFVLSQCHLSKCSWCQLYFSAVNLNKTAVNEALSCNYLPSPPKKKLYLDKVSTILIKGYRDFLLSPRCCTDTTWLLCLFSAQYGRVPMTINQFCMQGSGFRSVSGWCLKHSQVRWYLLLLLSDPDLTCTLPSYLKRQSYPQPAGSLGWKTPLLVTSDTPSSLFSSPLQVQGLFW